MRSVCFISLCSPVWPLATCIIYISMQKGMARGMARADLADFADFVACGLVVDSLSVGHRVAGSRPIRCSVLSLPADDPTSLAICPRAPIRGTPFSVFACLVSDVYSCNLCATQCSTPCSVHNTNLPKNSRFHCLLPHWHRQAPQKNISKKLRKVQTGCNVQAHTPEHVVATPACGHILLTPS